MGGSSPCTPEPGDFISWTSLRDKLAAVVLLARRLKAASPDALHPGKAGEESEGESLLSHRIFPAFLGQKPTSFRLPKLQADVAAFFPGSLFAKYGSRGFNPLAQVWGRGAPSVPLCRICYTVFEIWLYVLLCHSFVSPVALRAFSCFFRGGIV